MDETELVSRARTALEQAHVPYSEYSVGAAIETASGAVYTGCNIEIANYSNSLHAEEVAVGKATSDGHQQFDRIAVSSSERDGILPCGMCRQTLTEFCDQEFVVLCDTGDGTARYQLGELLPDAITSDDLELAG
jgi:cytidine deaminase, homotetrameric